MTADIHAATTGMARQAAEFDTKAHHLNSNAQALLDEARRLADEHIAHAQKVAAEMVSAANAKAAELRAQADRASETGAWLRRLVTGERKTAGLDDLPELDTLRWTDPQGRIFDLAAHFATADGHRWHWTGHYDTSNGGPAWPVMARADFTVTEPWHRLPGLIELVPEEDLPDKLPRHHTPPRIEHRDGQRLTVITTQRMCNGCGRLLGDATDAELTEASEGRPLPDVRRECPDCAPDLVGPHATVGEGA